MDWSTLLPTTLGGLIAAGEGVATQAAAARSARKAEERAESREARQWVRGRVSEAHYEFLIEFDSRFQVINEEVHGPTPEDWLIPLEYKFQALRLVCSADSARQAERALQALREHAFEGGRWEPVEWAFDQYLLAARAELQLGAIPVMGNE
jgi:hypothetical protein